MGWDPIGPNFSHHKAMVQPVGWFPVGGQETKGADFLLPPPPPRPPPPTEMVLNG